jgi:hypothetical protein
LPIESAAGAFKYLLEQREIVYVGTGRDLSYLRDYSDPNEQGAKSAIIFGNPAFNIDTSVIAQNIIGAATNVISKPNVAGSTLHEPPGLGYQEDNRQLPRDWSENVGSALDELINDADRKLRSLGWHV